MGVGTCINKLIATGWVRWGTGCERSRTDRVYVAEHMRVHTHGDMLTHHPGP